MDWDDLIDAARVAQSRAYAPFSRFPVGAAMRMEDDSIVSGCNVENRSYGLCVCAERTAIGTAVNRGLRRPKALVVVTEATPPAPPCGMCRETLAEFASGDLPILMLNDRNERRETTLGELFPEPFELDPDRHL